ncbi:hypothetical protein FA13DRAFT_324006 [Coprinellus micaceus]|uniref:Uncharacterized protein n=1 Tax=Coprinellus micaceus TaxID=71717 RepID=A0A4Y7SDN3_COPMI|nr:hypothetical protein FA13DRAFT_324006 [Coprinellus micaceus]
MKPSLTSTSDREERPTPLCWVRRVSASLPHLRPTYIYSQSLPTPPTQKLNHIYRLPTSPSSLRQSPYSETHSHSPPPSPTSSIYLLFALRLSLLASPLTPSPSTRPSASSPSQTAPQCSSPTKP